MSQTKLKHLRSISYPHGTAYYFVATYLPAADPAEPAKAPRLPITVKFRLPGDPSLPAFTREYYRTLDTLRRGAVWVR
jgi:hypothetical protein